MSDNRPERPRFVLTDPAEPPVWEFYLSSLLPEVSSRSAVGCVAIRNLTAGEVVLTIKTAANTSDPERINRLEIPGGGIEPGEGELDALKREEYEESGFRFTHPRFFGYKKYYNDRSDDPRYAGKPISYMLFFWDYNIRTPDQPSDPDQASGCFRHDSLVIIEKSGWIKPCEVAIIGFGLKAAKEYYDNPKGLPR